MNSLQKATLHKAIDATAVGATDGAFVKVAAGALLFRGCTQRKQQRACVASAQRGAGRARRNAARQPKRRAAVSYGASGRTTGVEVAQPELANNRAGLGAGVRGAGARGMW